VRFFAFRHWPSVLSVRSAELLSNALKNFVGQSVILDGASQYYASHRRYQ
jgi:hypothetical protein